MFYMAIGRDLIILSFHISFWDFFGSVGREKNFFPEIFLRIIIVKSGYYFLSFFCMIIQVKEQLFYPVKRRNKWTDQYFTGKVSEIFLGRGFWLWVGWVRGNDNIFCPALVKLPQDNNRFYTLLKVYPLYLKRFQKNMKTLSNALLHNLLSFC